MNVAFVNSYFDGNDYENPIKDYLDGRILDYLIDKNEKFISINLKQNTVSVQDDIFHYSLDGIDSSFKCNEN